MYLECDASWTLHLNSKYTIKCRAEIEALFKSTLIHK